MRLARRGSPGPWYGRFAERLRFERGAARAYPRFRVAQGRGHGRVYIVTVDVPGYDSRQIEIHFRAQEPYDPRVFADGPSDSPHRFQSGALCIWDGRDPPELRWTFEDGLLHLIVLAQAHAFKEAWWRERGEWLGPEAPHNDKPDGARSAA